MRRYVLAGLLGLGLAGCGGTPRIDTTDDATAKASMQAMTAGMTEAEKRTFAHEVAALTMGPMMQRMFAKPTEGGHMGAAEAMKPLHGLTAAEIHAKAEVVRAKLKASKAARAG